MYSVRLVGTRRSPGPAEIFGLDKSDEFAYENTSFDYEFCPQPLDGCPKTFESNEVL